MPWLHQPHLGGFPHVVPPHKARLPGPAGYAPRHRVQPRARSPTSAPSHPSRRPRAASRRSPWRHRWLGRARCGPFGTLSNLPDPIVRCLHRLARGHARTGLLSRSDRVNVVRLEQAAEKVRAICADLAARRDRVRAALAGTVPPLAQDEGLAAWLRASGAPGGLGDVWQPGDRGRGQLLSQSERSFLKCPVGSPLRKRTTGCGVEVRSQPLCLASGLHERESKGQCAPSGNCGSWRLARLRVDHKKTPSAAAEGA